LQKNAIIKVENDVDVQDEEGTFHMKIEEVYVPSAFCVEKPEPEVSLVFRCFCARVPTFCQFKSFSIWHPFQGIVTVPRV
jgi:hypothetical protein